MVSITMVPFLISSPAQTFPRMSVISARLDMMFPRERIPLMTLSLSEAQEYWGEGLALGNQLTVI